MTADAAGRWRRLAAETALNALAGALTVAASFVLGVLSARQMPTDEYGQAQFQVWLAQACWIIVSMGLPATITRAMSQAPASISRIAGNHASRGIAMLLAILSLGAVACWIGGSRQFPVTVATASLFATFAIQALLQSFHAGWRSYRAILAGAAVNFVLALAGYQWLLKDLGVAGLLWSMALGSASACVVMVAALRIEARQSPAAGEGYASLRPYARFALEAWVASLVSAFVWQRSELFFVQKFLGGQDAGFFSIGISLATLACYPVVMLGSALLPHFSQQAGIAHLRELNADYRIVTKLFAGLSFLACFFVAANAEFFVTWLYGERYRPATGLAALLVAGSAFGNFAVVASTALYALGKPRVIAVYGGAGAIVAVVAALFVAPAFGTTGMAILRISIQAAIVIGCIAFLQREAGLRFPAGKFTLLVLVAAAAVAASSWLIRVDTLLTAALALAVAAALFALGARLAGVLHRDELEAIRAMARSTRG